MLSDSAAPGGNSGGVSHRLPLPSPLLFAALSPLLSSPLSPLLSPLCEEATSTSLPPPGLGAACDFLGLQTRGGDGDRRIWAQYVARCTLEAAKLHVKPVREAFAADDGDVSPLASPDCASPIPSPSATPISPQQPQTSSKQYNNAAFHTQAVLASKRAGLMLWRGDSWSRLFMSHAVQVLPELIDSFREVYPEPDEARHPLLTQAAALRTGRLTPPSDPSVAAHTALVAAIADLLAAPNSIQQWVHAQPDGMDQLAAALLLSFCSAVLKTSRYHTALAANCLKPSSGADVVGSATLSDEAWIDFMILFQASAILSTPLLLSATTVSGMKTSTFFQVVVPMMQLFAVASPLYCPALGTGALPTLSQYFDATVSGIIATEAVNEAVLQAAAELSADQLRQDAAALSGCASNIATRLVEGSTSTKGSESTTGSVQPLTPPNHFASHGGFILAGMIKFAASIGSLAVASCQAVPLSSAERPVDINRPTTFHTIMRFASIFQTGGSKYTLTSPSAATGSLQPLVANLAASLGATRASRWQDFDAHQSELVSGAGPQTIRFIDTFIRLPFMQPASIQRGSTLNEPVHFALSLLDETRSRPSPRGLLLRAYLQSKTPLKGLAARKQHYPELETMMLAALLLHTLTTSRAAAETDPVPGDRDRSVELGGPWRSASRAISLFEAGFTPSVSLNERGHGVINAELAAAFDRQSPPETLLILWQKVTDLRKWLGERFEEYRQLPTTTSVPASPIPVSTPREVPSQDTSTGMASDGLSTTLPGFPENDAAFREGVIARLRFVLTHASAPLPEDGCDAAGAQHIVAASLMCSAYFRQAATSGFLPGLPPQRFMHEDPSLSTERSKLSVCCNAVMLFVREGWVLPPSVFSSLMIVRTARCAARLGGLQTMAKLLETASKHAVYLVRDIVLAASSCMVDSPGMAGLVEDRAIIKSAMLIACKDVVKFGTEIGLTSLPIFAARRTEGSSSLIQALFDAPGPVRPPNHLSKMCLNSGVVGHLSRINSELVHPTVSHHSAFLGSLSSLCLLYLWRDAKSGKVEALADHVNKAYQFCAPNVSAQLFQAYTAVGSTTNALAAIAGAGMVESRALYDVRDTLTRSCMEMVTRALTEDGAPSQRTKRRVHTRVVHAAVLPLLHFLFTDWVDEYGGQAPASATFQLLLSQTGCLRALSDTASYITSSREHRDNILPMVQLAIEGHVGQSLNFSSPWMPISVGSFRVLITSGMMSLLDALVFILAGCARVGKTKAFVEILSNSGFAASIPENFASSISRQDDGAVGEPIKSLDDPVCDQHTDHMTSQAHTVMVALLNLEKSIFGYFREDISDAHSLLLAAYEHLFQMPAVVRITAIQQFTQSALNSCIQACASSVTGGSNEDVVADLPDEQPAEVVGGPDDLFSAAARADVMTSIISTSTAAALCLVPSQTYAAWRDHIHIVCDSLFRNLCLNCCRDSTTVLAFIERLQQAASTSRPSIYIDRSVLEDIRTLTDMLRIIRPTRRIASALVEVCISILGLTAVAPQYQFSWHVRIAALTLLIDILPLLSPTEVASIALAHDHASVRSVAGGAGVPGRHAGALLQPKMLVLSLVDLVSAAVVSRGAGSVMNEHASQLGKDSVIMLRQGGTGLPRMQQMSTAAAIALIGLRQMMSESNPWSPLLSSVIHDAILAGAAALQTKALPLNTVAAIMGTNAISLDLQRLAGSLAVLGGWRNVPQVGIAVDIRLPSGDRTRMEYTAVVVDMLSVPCCTLIPLSRLTSMISSANYWDEWVINTASGLSEVNLWASTNGLPPVNQLPEFALHLPQDAGGFSTIDIWEVAAPNPGLILPSSALIEALFQIITPEGGVANPAVFSQPPVPDEVASASSILGPASELLAMSIVVDPLTHVCSILQMQGVAVISQLVHSSASEKSTSTASFLQALLAAGAFSRLLKLALQPIPLGLQDIPYRLYGMADTIRGLAWLLHSADGTAGAVPILPTRGDICGYDPTSKARPRGPLLQSMFTAASGAGVIRAHRKSQPSASPPPLPGPSPVAEQPPKNANIARWSKTEELASVLGGPTYVSKAACYEALTAHNDDADSALSWLFDNPASWKPLTAQGGANAPDNSEAIPDAEDDRPITDGDMDAGDEAYATYHSALEALYASKKDIHHRPSLTKRISLGATGTFESAAEAVRFDECITEGIAFNEPLIIDVPANLPAGYTQASKLNVLALAANRVTGQSAVVAPSISAVTDVVVREGASAVGDDADPGTSTLTAAGLAAHAPRAIGPDERSALQGKAEQRSEVVELRSYEIRRIGVNKDVGLRSGDAVLHAVQPAVSVNALEPGTLVWVSTSTAALQSNMLLSLESGSGFLAFYLGMVSCGPRSVARVAIPSGTIMTVPVCSIATPLSIFGFYCCDDENAWVAANGTSITLPSSSSKNVALGYLRAISCYIHTTASTALARQLFIHLCTLMANAGASSADASVPGRCLLPADIIANSGDVLKALKLFAVQDQSLARDSGVFMVSTNAPVVSTSRSHHPPGFYRPLWRVLQPMTGISVEAMRALLAVQLRRETGDASWLSDSEWQCPRCTVVNVDVASCAVCKASGPKPADVQLSELLVAEALQHLATAADACAVAGERAVTKGSSHPLCAQTSGFDIGSVTFDDATVLWVTFDSRCETDPGDDSSYIEFYAEDPRVVTTSMRLPNGTAVRGGLVAHLSGAPHMFVPFMVRGTTITYVISRGKARRGVSGDGGWGLQFTITPLSAMLWSSEIEALESGTVTRNSKPQVPSLLWGCWLLEFLLSGALTHGQLLRGLVHNTRLVALCIDYLRTTAAPNKDRIASLLHKLLSSSEYTVITPVHCDYQYSGAALAIESMRRQRAPPAFNSKEESELLQPLTIIPLRFVDVIRQLLNARLSEASATSVGAALFLPRSLQRLVELVATIESALRRARVQLHLLLTFNAGFYADASRMRQSPLLLPLPSTLSQESKLVFSIASRSDRDVPYAPYFQPGASMPTAAAWAPSLVGFCPTPLDQLIVSQALLHLRDILVALITRRRAPDAWVTYALMTSHSSKAVSAWSAGEISSFVTQDKLAWAHWTMGKFELTPAANEAVCSWLSKWAARKCLASALDVQCSELEVHETDAAAYPLLGSLSIAELRLRASFLLIINTLIQKVLPYIDMSNVDEHYNLDASILPGSSESTGYHGLHRLPLGAILRRIPEYILVDAKEKLITDAISASETPGVCPLKVCLDNRAAMASADIGITDPLASLCTFAQMYRFMIESRVSDKQLRHKLTDKEYLFEVSYVGLAGSNEEGLDWGGLYRDSLVRTMEDLFSTEQQGIDLFSQTPNAIWSRSSEEAAAEVAQATQMHTASDGSFVPNPKYAAAGPGLSTAWSYLPAEARAAAHAVPSTTLQAAAISMFEFVGKLMGISVRTRACLDFDLAPLVWKLLVEDKVLVEDVILVDSKLGQFLKAVRDFVPSAATDARMDEDAREQAFAERFGDLRFVMPDPYGAPAKPGRAASAVPQVSSAPLIPGGAELRVSMGNRSRYIACAVEAFCNRYRTATSAMRRGITGIIPDRAVRLTSWRDLQRLVCGEADIDLDILKKNTAYDSRGVYSDSHPNIKAFWAVMETLTSEQKRNFVRFAWGRSRLPRGTWPKNYRGEQVKFKIVPKMNYDGLPLAHTCFFLIELPVYPNVDVMRQRLLTAITYGAGEGFWIA